MGEGIRARWTYSWLDESAQVLLQDLYDRAYIRLTLYKSKVNVDCKSWLIDLLSLTILEITFTLVFLTKTVFITVRKALVRFKLLRAHLLFLLKFLRKELESKLLFLTSHFVLYALNFIKGILHMAVDSLLRFFSFLNHLSLIINLNFLIRLTLNLVDYLNIVERCYTQYLL